MLHYCFQSLQDAMSLDDVLISRNYKMCNFVWLIFLDIDQPINRKNLKIPYQCEFYIIKRCNPTSYEIREIYSVKDNPFFQYLGIWENGLKMTNISMYHRRLNLNGTQINTVYIPVVR